jgi:hypothetical protein
VAIELALKNASPTFDHGHDLSILINKVVPAPSSGLQAQLTTLQRALGALICTNRGARTPVNPAMYTGIRYVRHEKDGFVGDTTEALLKQALADAEQLIAELRRSGVHV